MCTTEASTWLIRLPIPSLPPGYAPFGIQDINGLVYVAFAQADEAPGGYIDIFEEDGTFVKPWPGALESALGFRRGAQEFWQTQQHAAGLEQYEQRNHQRLQSRNRPVVGTVKRHEREGHRHRPTVGTRVWRRLVEQRSDKPTILHRRSIEQSGRNVWCDRLEVDKSSK
jgi:hypothetical protein